MSRRTLYYEKLWHYQGATSTDPSENQLINGLNVKTQEDLERVSEADLKSIGFKRLHRRRFLYGMARLPKRDAYAKRDGALAVAARRVNANRAPHAGRGAPRTGH